MPAQAISIWPPNKSVCGPGFPVLYLVGANHRPLHHQGPGSGFGPLIPIPEEQLNK